MSSVDTGPLATDPSVAAERPPRRRRMTEDQFVAWAQRTNRRAEWVDGEVELMNAVEWGHIDLTGFLNRVLGIFVETHRLGRVAGEPYQIRLPQQRRRRQPDLFVIGPASLHLIERMQFTGVPDLIVEVVSPDSQTRDRRVKFREYQAAKVPEYWLPDPGLRTFEGYRLGADGRYVRLPDANGLTDSAVMTGAFFQHDWLWQPWTPDALPILTQMNADRHRLLSSPPPPPSDNDR